MKNRNLITVLLAVVVFAFSFYACENTDEASTNQLIEEEVLDNEMVATEIDDEVLAEIDEELLSINYFKSADNEKCPLKTVSPEDGSFPRIITKDFGDGCAIKFGVKKTGKIIITLTDKWNALNSQRIVSFEDFYINDRKVEGERIITYLGDSEAGNMLFKVEGSTIITKLDGKVITRTFDRVREKIIEVHSSGNKRITYSITGTITGTNGDDNVFTSTILEPIIRSPKCKWALSGIKQIEINEHVIILNYTEGENNGECDPLVLRTVDDNEPEVINLERRKAN